MARTTKEENGLIILTGENSMKFQVIHIAKRMVLVASFFMAVFFGQSIALADEVPNEKTIIPATSADIWQAIDKQAEELSKTINSDKLGEVHHYAFAIRDLVDALPEHSSQLSADKLDQVKANVKYVDTLAQRLDANGDANDKDGVKTNATKLQKLLESIRSNYLMPQSESKASTIQNTKK
jgi:hypothetical protein